MWWKCEMLGDSIMCSLCVCVHMCRGGFLEAGSPEQFTPHIFSTSFLLVVQHFCFIHPVGCVFVWYLMLWCQKGKDTSTFYLLLTVWGHRVSGVARGLCSPWVSINSLLQEEPLGSCWGSGAHFVLDLWTEMFAVWAELVWKNSSIRIWETEDRPEPGCLTAGMWCGVFMCSDRWS